MMGIFQANSPAKFVVSGLGVPCLSGRPGGFFVLEPQEWGSYKKNLVSLGVELLPVVMVNQVSAGQQENEGM